MSLTKLVRSQAQNEAPHSCPVLEWVNCHPEALLFSSLEVGSIRADRRATQREAPERRVETEADIVDGELPLFV